MDERANYGEPDLEIDGFQLWIHGREFPQSQDYYDGNWLRITAHCGARGADVWISGSLLMVTDLVSFGKDCEALAIGSTEKATLNPMEPELEISLERSDSLGHFTAVVDITPDHMDQEHRFEFETDQTYLHRLTSQCQQIAKKYPIRGADQIAT